MAPIRRLKREQTRALGLLIAAARGVEEAEEEYERALAEAKRVRVPGWRIAKAGLISRSSLYRKLKPKQPPGQEEASETSQ
jgi:hypothetical protein